MKERSGLSDPGRFLAAVLYYTELELVRFDVFGLSNILRTLPFCEQLKPFVQLDAYAERAKHPEQWYSFTLKSAIDELVEWDLVMRVDHNWLFVKRDLLRAVVRELADAVTDLMDHSLPIAKTAQAIRNAHETKD